jgi:two-component system, NarL family, response regulator DevR
VAEGRARLRITISSSEPLVLAGIQAALEHERDLEVVGEGRTADDTLALLERERPEAALLDTGLTGAPVLSLLMTICGQHPTVAPILFADTQDLDQAQAAFGLGAAGYIVASIDDRDLPAAIRLAVCGTAFYARGLPALDDGAAARAAGLTERERNVLQLVARGLSNREIAKELWITEHTVKFHLANVYRKAGVANRANAIHWALLHGIG